MKVNRPIAYACTSDRKGATSNSGKSGSRNRQTIGGRGPKSLSSRDVMSPVRENCRKYSRTSACSVAPVAPGKDQNPFHQFPRSFPVASPQQVGAGKSPLCLLCRVVSQIPNLLRTR